MGGRICTRSCGVKRTNNNNNNNKGNNNTMHTRAQKHLVGLVSYSALTVVRLETVVAETAVVMGPLKYVHGQM